MLGVPQFVPQSVPSRPDPERRLTAPAHATGLLCCGTCEAPLELACPTGCDPLPPVTRDGNLSAENARLRKELSGAATRARNEARQLEVAVRERDRMAQERADLAHQLAAARELLVAHRGDMTPERPGAVRTPGVRAPLKFKPKLCACGAMFTPTGGRDTRCPACKEAPGS